MRVLVKLFQMRNSVSVRFFSAIFLSLNPLRLSLPVAMFAVFMLTGILSTGLSSALENVTGINRTADEGFGARSGSLGGLSLSMPGEAASVANFPAALRDVTSVTVIVGHSSRMSEASYDYAVAAMPLEKATLGLGLARYGVDNIPLTDVNTHLQNNQIRYFSVADYMAIFALARSWKNLDVGANLALLLRDYDQIGMGMRGDLSARYRYENYTLSALSKGFLPSSARWESGYSEYEDPDVYFGIGGRWPAPYFYGEMRAAFESEGLFQKKAKSASALRGSRAWEGGDPLLSGNLGAEFLFDFGLAFRAGIAELRPAVWDNNYSLGLGYTWMGRIGIDYGFSAQPELGGSHRLSLHWFPFGSQVSPVNRGTNELPRRNQVPEREPAEELEGEPEGEPEVNQSPRDEVPGIPEKAKDIKANGIETPKVQPVEPEQKPIVPEAKEILEEEEFLEN